MEGRTVPVFTEGAFDFFPRCCALPGVQILGVFRSVPLVLLRRVLFSFCFQGFITSVWRHG